MDGSIKPIVFRYKGYRFFFFSNEGIPIEPVHIHVQKNECLAKFWIVPEISLAESYGFRDSELLMLLKLIAKNENLIMEKWNEYFDL